MTVDFFLLVESKRKVGDTPVVLFNPWTNHLRNGPGELAAGFDRLGPQGDVASSRECVAQVAREGDLHIPPIVVGPVDDDMRGKMMGAAAETKMKGND